MPKARELRHLDHQEDTKGRFAFLVDPHIGELTAAPEVLDGADQGIGLSLLSYPQAGHGNDGLVIGAYSAP